MDHKTAAGEFIASLEADRRSPHTVGAYRSDLTAFCQFAGDIDIDQVTPALLQRFGECDQDYIRADWLEGRILSEVQTIFRDEALLTQIWAEAEKKLAAELPDADADRRRLEAERTKVQSALDRYFAAFEAGTMAPGACRERVDALTAQVRQLDAELVAQEGRRHALTLPELKMDFLEQILTNLEGIVAAVPPAQKKHLLRLLVEKVLVRDRSEVEIWYKLPQSTPVRTLSDMVAPGCQYANPRGRGHAGVGILPAFRLTPAGVSRVARNGPVAYIRLFRNCSSPAT
ncbi:MAG: site-specific integrase [Anaerolineae bacterium]